MAVKRAVVGFCLASGTVAPVEANPPLPCALPVGRSARGICPDGTKATFDGDAEELPQPATAVATRRRANGSHRALLTATGRLEVLATTRTSRKRRSPSYAGSLEIRARGRPPPVSEP